MLFQTKSFHTILINMMKKDQDKLSGNRWQNPSDLNIIIKYKVQWQT